MALYVFLGGVADPTSELLIGIWPEQAGDYVVTVGSSVQTVSVATVADYQGCTWANKVTGLSRNVPYSVSGPDGTVSAVARLAPATGVHKTVLGSCFNDNFFFDVTIPAMSVEQPHQFVSLGDFPYSDNQRQVTTTPTLATQRLQLKKTINKSHVQDLLQSVAWSAVTSDHDVYAGNDAPGRSDIVAGNAFPGDAAINYYARLFALPDVINVAGEASSAYKGWPTANAVDAWEQMMNQGEALFDETHRIAPNPDVGVDFGGGAVPAGAPYTRWTVGRVEYFLVEQFRYCDYTSDTGTGRTMLGAAQLAWFLARVKASTAPFKVLLFAQLLLKVNDYKTTGGGARNDYGHTCFSDEAEIIKDALTEFTDWTAPGGVVLFTGDVHTMQVHWMDRGEGLLQIVPCPGGTGLITQPSGTGDSPDTTLIQWDTYSSDNGQRFYGYIEDDGSGPLICQIKDDTRRVRYEARIVEGSNVPTYALRRSA